MAGITDDKLVWIYTNYGLRRITEVMENPEQRLLVTKLKIGDSKTIVYDEVTGLPEVHYDYYEPNPEQTELVNVIDQFMFHGKYIDEEAMTVTFVTDIPADSSGYLINEMGIYETVDGVDFLIAVCTCQAVSKPLLSDNYIISINLNITLHSKNLCSIYDRILLNVDSEYLLPSDLEQVEYNILYMEGNLMEQITINSDIIGLNRPRQLELEIDDYANNSSIALITSLYNNISKLVGYENVQNFWLFDWCRYTGIKNSIVDLGAKGEYLSTTNDTALTDRRYEGLAPYFDFSNNNFFTTQNIAEDTDNTFTFLLKNNNKNRECILLAKSDYILNLHDYEIIRTKENGIKVKVFYDDEGTFLSFETADDIIPTDFYTLTVVLPKVIGQDSVKVYVNGLSVDVNETTNHFIRPLNQYIPLTDPTTYIRNFTEAGYTSYIQNENLEIKNPINSKLSIIANVGVAMTHAQVRGLALTLQALSGINVCMRFQ